MSYATASEASAKVETMQGVINDLDPIVMRVMKVASALTIIGDRLEGSRPEGVAEQSPETPPHGMLDELQRKRRALQRACDAAENCIPRLERILGLNQIQGAMQSPGRNIV